LALEFGKILFGGLLATYFKQLPLHNKSPFPYYFLGYGKSASYVAMKKTPTTYGLG